MMQPSDKDPRALLDFMALMRSAEEAEKTRVARRLHDDVGQALAAVRMKWYALEARLNAADPAVAAEMQAVMPILEGAISEVREVSEALRPGILGLGIEAAIEWQAERFESEHDIACVVDIETDQRPLDPSRTTELFRIFQDALATLRLHPGAKAIDVTLRREGNDILLEIRADGDPPGADESIEHALGILTMKERTERAGGTFAIYGTALEVRMPLNG